MNLHPKNSVIGLKDKANWNLHQITVISGFYDNKMKKVSIYFPGCAQQQFWHWKFKHVIKVNSKWQGKDLIQREKSPS